MIKLLRPIILFAMRSLWYITRPVTSGAKVVIICGDEILLIKTTYGYAYSLPGGCLKKNELPEEGAKRETLEEVGIELKKLLPLPSFVTFEEYKKDTVYSFYSYVSSKEYTLDRFEIDVAKWHTLDNLPPLGKVTTKIIKLYKDTASNK